VPRSVFYEQQLRRHDAVAKGGLDPGDLVGVGAIAPVSIKSIIWYALQLDPSTFGIFDAFQA
jgi:hypothetical protein